MAMLPHNRYQLCAVDSAACLNHHDVQIVVQPLPERCPEHGCRLHKVEQRRHCLQCLNGKGPMCTLQKEWSTTHTVHHSMRLLTLLCSAAGMTELTSASLATLVARVASHDLLLLFADNGNRMAVLAFWMPARHTADTSSSLTAAAEKPPIASTCSSQQRLSSVRDDCMWHTISISKSTFVMEAKTKEPCLHKACSGEECSEAGGAPATAAGGTRQQHVAARLPQHTAHPQHMRPKVRQ